AGRVDPLGVDEPGSVSVIGAVSPPGGDFTEPVTQNTLRVVKTFWALDKDLANKRHFPAISWTDSYSEYDTLLHDWFEDEVDEEWGDRIRAVRDLLQEDEQLQETVQLVGKDALPERQQLTLEVARMVKEFFLQQDAFHEVDTFCSPEKTMDILRLILDFGDEAEAAMERGATLDELMDLESKQMVSDIKFEEDYETLISDIREQMDEDFAQVGGQA
ncbi:MAG: V-type ATP synthase subunit A, partial [Candidatus Nanohaloarchaea archaeon]|nr:V-type ATP synthase subunit A [Candidatus Nanohaloarchaea archaeon]